MGDTRQWNDSGQYRLYGNVHYSCATATFEYSL
uniref:Astacin domain-containing protein n=1 Tax=Ascaris lumbricoides TaxID=6252 RepID=A0A0M3HPW2_ASCLU